jgi:hypothetical protein
LSALYVFREGGQACPRSVFLYGLLLELFVLELLVPELLLPGVVAAP